MKKCIHQMEYKIYSDIVFCNRIGAARSKCPVKCKFFHPTLLYRLFGKWWKR